MVVRRTTLKDFGAILDSELRLNVLSRLDRTQNRWSRLAATLTKQEVLESISRGVSPVKGGGGQTGGQARYMRYSRSYIKQIKEGRHDRFGKKQRPVNLQLTGKMLRSIRSRETRAGYSVWFTSSLAEIHQTKGAGKSQVTRKLLPAESGQEYSRVITRKILSLYNRIFSETN